MRPVHHGLPLSIVAAAILALPAQAPGPPRGSPAFSVIEASVTDLRRAMDEGRTTSREITDQYLARIARYNGTLNAAITINPQARADADARDRERRQRVTRGPLHGVPIALKDNIQTLGMPTTGGALAFRNLLAPYEATITRRLLEAGAVIIAKTTLTELANWVSPGMPTGYNAILRYSANPYDPRVTLRDGRSVPVRLPGGSSSGIGTAASLWAASVGSETSGSILNPSHETMLVGIKPTVGRLSRYGIIPISGDQDTPGPMARSVTDAAILLGAMEGATPDPNDAATHACTAPPNRDYTRFLQRDALRGARIGVPRASFAERSPTVGIRVGGSPATPPGPMDGAIEVLRLAGATVVDPADLPSIITKDRAASLLEWPICSGRDPADTSCSIVLSYGMKRDFNRWLASLGKAAPVRTLAELRAWNSDHRSDGAIEFGQRQLDASDAIDLTRERARYLHDLEKDRRLSRTEGIDAALQTARLDALIFPAHFGANVAARAGYPSVIVPFPGRADAAGTAAPFSVTFTGTACSEPRLVALAFAFEQRTKRRIPPRLD